MGIRFHKSLPLGSLFRLNFSKSGPSLSMGKAGADINFGPRGLRSTVGMPGSGFSYIATGKKWVTLLLAVGIALFWVYSTYVNPPPAPQPRTHTHASHARHVDVEE
jgi:hypothetical protein